MGSVGRNIQCVASVHGRLLATEGRFHLTFEQDKGLLEVMPMRRWPAAWRDVHINYAEAFIRIFARHDDGVGVADQTDMRKVVGLRQGEPAFEVVRWDRWSSWHVGSPLWGLGLFVVSLKALTPSKAQRFLWQSPRIDEAHAPGDPLGSRYPPPPHRSPVRDTPETSRGCRTPTMMEPAFSSAPRTRPCRPRNRESPCQADHSRSMPSWDHLIPP